MGLRLTGIFTLMASEDFRIVRYTCEYYVTSPPPGLASITVTDWCHQVERSANGPWTTHLAHKAWFQTLLELSIVTRAKRKCKQDDSDSKCNNIDSDRDDSSDNDNKHDDSDISDRDDRSESGDDHDNMGDCLAARASSIPAEGPANLELPGAIDDVLTAKSEIFGSWGQRTCGVARDRKGQGEGAGVGSRWRQRRGKAYLGGRR
jgi:hypothetical protein